MRRRDAFSLCHPAAQIVWFLPALLFPMVTMEPVCLLISLFSAGAWSARLQGGGVLLRRLRWALPAALLPAAVNALFNHRGETVLFTLPTGSPFTLESLLCGGGAGLLFLTEIVCFSCFNEALSPDKLLFLFGRAAPSLGLTLSLAFGFVPRFGAQLREIQDAQRALGRDLSRGGPVQKLKRALSMLSVLVSWALENAVHTADSMKSRGYGLPGRTSFSAYRFGARDLFLLLWSLFWSVFFTWGWLTGGFFWEWYPTLRIAPFTALNLFLRLGFLLFCLTPLLLDGWDALLWAGAARRMRKEADGDGAAF